MHTLIVTGPESTGKSTLARLLAQRLGGLYVPEYPRGYLQAAERHAKRADFQHFAQVDRDLQEAAGLHFADQDPAGQANFIVRDTGAEVLHLWMEDKFESASEAVVRAWQQQQPSCYLLCRPDLPWAPDPLREDPHRRTLLYERLQMLLLKQTAPVVEVAGFDESRLRLALKQLDALQLL